MLMNLLSPPTFADEDAAYQASQLWRIVLTMLALSVIYIIAWLALGPEYPSRIVLAAPLFPLFALLFHLIKRGKLKLAGSLMVGGVWLILFFAASFSGGVVAPGYSGLLITVLAAGIFMSRGWAAIIATISIAGGALLISLESSGILPPTREFADSKSVWLAQAVYFVVAASLLQMATSRIAHALERAHHDLEERKRKEAQLEEAERSYRELVESVPAVIYSAEPGSSGRWYYVSPRIESLTGYTAEEWIEDPDLWYSRIHPEDRDEYIPAEEKAIAEGRQFHMEYRFKKRDGSIIWIRDESMNVASFDSGNRKIVQGFLIDVTARKEAEAKLRSNEVLLSTIIENIPFDFWVCDENGRYILQNPVSRRLAGDLLGKTVEDLAVPPHILDDYRDKHKRALAGELIRSEDRYERDGEFLYALHIAAPIRDEERVNGFIGIAVDITEQKRTQEALRDAELLYRTLVEQTTVALYRDSALPGGPSIFITPQISNMIGYDPSEFTSRPDFWLSLLHPDDKERVMNVIDKIISTGESVTCEYRLKARDGRWIWVRDEASLIKDNEGYPLYVQGVYIDITNQKQMEAQREALIAELEAKNAELERFTYTVSHDLKAPLITMGGFLGFLEQDALNGDMHRLRQDIQRISEANLKMQRLLNELLELSRIGRIINAPEVIGFGQIVRDALSRVENRLKENQIEVKVGGGLPTIRGDRLRLVEVVQNLVDNAAKFMGSQKRPLIEIGAKTEGETHVFFVRDNGIGIDPKFHSKIFDLFNKLDPKAEGSGIGLALVKRILEVHGGSIWVESEAGNGATFYFTLPGKN
jgi:PAS domain S-box-containing protein